MIGYIIKTLDGISRFTDKGLGFFVTSKPLVVDDLMDQKDHGEFADLENIKGLDDQSFLARCKAYLEVLEKIRLEKLSVYQFRKKLAIPVAMVAVPLAGTIDYWLLWLQRNSDDGGAGITFLVAGAIYWWVTQPKREYIKAYKETMLPKIARLFGNLTYSFSQKIPMDVLKPSKIIPSHDSYNAEDFFTGSYKGTKISFSEIHLTERRGSGKNRRTVTTFKGLCILLAVPTRKFLGHTILERDKGKIMKWFTDKSRGLKHSNMVDPEFEKLFDVYTNDQVEARYLVDPLMIEDLKALYEEYNGESMAASWYDKSMLIMIASKHNHFEPADITVPATSPETVLSLKREIGQILSIIDRLEMYKPEDAAAA
jgi:hypothetical protein